MFADRASENMQVHARSLKLRFEKVRPEELRAVSVEFASGIWNKHHQTVGKSTRNVAYAPYEIGGSRGSGICQATHDFRPRGI